MAPPRTDASPGRAPRLPPSLPPLAFERRPGDASLPLSRRYRRREPERTALHSVVRGHLRAFLEDGRLRFDSGAGYPAFVEHEFRRYLDCGLLQHGFARLRCPSCGFEQLVAFSCKGRLCPSCWARRAAATAADLVDRVLPEARYRQWVLTFPWQMRFHLATDRAFQSAVLRAFLLTLAAWLRRRGRAQGIRDGQAGAVTFIQRFGGILNLNPHFHSLVPDGLFVPGPDGHAAFVPLPPPSDLDVARLAARLADRIGVLARMRFAQAGDELPFLDPDALPLKASAAEAVEVPGPRHRRGLVPDDLPLAAGDKPLCARTRGFSLHAARAVEPGDRDGLEQLCRYGLRAPLALDRLSLDPAGRVRYRLHRPWPTPDGRTEILLDPVAFLRRLAALLPAPYQNLVRYHGVFANRSRLRPLLPAPATRRGSTAPGFTAAPALPEALVAGAADSPATAPPGEVRHRPSRHLGWAALLRRVLDADALACPKCASPLVVLAFLTDPDVVRRILEHLRLPTAPPTDAPATTGHDPWGDDPAPASWADPADARRGPTPAPRLRQGAPRAPP